MTQAAVSGELEQSRLVRERIAQFNRPGTTEALSAELWRSEFGLERSGKLEDLDDRAAWKLQKVRTFSFVVFICDFWSTCAGTQCSGKS